MGDKHNLTQKIQGDMAFQNSSQLSKNSAKLQSLELIHRALFGHLKQILPELKNFLKFGDM
jgi:hypothetical protein